MLRKCFLKRFFSVVLSLVFMLGVCSECCFALSITNIFKKDLAAAEPLPPAMKMYAKCEAVTTEINKKTLSAANAKFESLQALYDGNADTVFENGDTTEVILDLGKIHMLGGIRITLPKYKETAEKSRCIGTGFYVSADKKEFRKAAEISAVDFSDNSAEVKEVMFGGAGEYRYVKAVIPSGARIAQLDWLEYPEWVYTKNVNGKYDMKLRLYAYDIQKNINARIVAAIYNPDGILKCFSVLKEDFDAGAEKEVELAVTGINRENGDSCRVMIWDEDGTPSLNGTLVYRDSGAAAFTLPKVFADNMVLQADKPLLIWGNAPTGVSVNVLLENLRGGSVAKEVKADRDSSWTAELGSFSAGGEYRLTVSCGGEKKEYSNLTFGDIWLCIGQSNIEYYMYCGKDTTKYLKSKDGKAESDNHNIRFLNLLNKGIEGAGAPLEDIPVLAGVGEWNVMDAASAGYCSAIGYYFAQKVNAANDIPIGLICAAVGDTEIARWLPEGSYGSFESKDGGLFYNRISPLSKLQIRGILMYQGEADQYRTHLSAVQYRDAMSGMVDLCRGIWGDELPFYWAQLTRYNKDESNVREGQRLAQYHVKNQKNTGVISLLDIYGEYRGETGSSRADIHPHQKEIAAERFFRYACRDIYGGGKPASGPVYKEMKVVGDSIELTFDTTGDLTVMPVEQYADLTAKRYIKKNNIDTGIPQEFEIAGADGKYKKAKASINGNKIILKSDAVSKPVSARYAWGAYPEMPNLTDASGLPVLTFTTDGE